jgi:hypothetical protein
LSCPVNAISQSSDFMLFDSGSDEHVCRRDYAPNAPVSSGDQTFMRDARGNVIPSHGKKKVKFRVPLDDGSDQAALADFAMGDIKEGAILSAGKLLRQGFKAYLDNGCHLWRGESLLSHLEHITKADIVIERNSLYLPVNVQELVVAPLEAEVEADVPAPSSPFLPMPMEDDWYKQAREADEAKWYGKANVQEALPPAADADAVTSSVDDVALHVALADGQVLSHLSPVRLMKERLK